MKKDNQNKKAAKKNQKNAATNLEMAEEIITRESTARNQNNDIKDCRD